MAGARAATTCGLIATLSCSWLPLQLLYRGSCHIGRKSWLHAARAATPALVPEVKLRDVSTEWQTKARLETTRARAENHNEADQAQLRVQNTGRPRVPEQRRMNRKTEEAVYWPRLASL
eukprot:5282563-Amphidinium_carterae.1